MMKFHKIAGGLLLIVCLFLYALPTHAVLKEKDINATLTILRQELMDKHDELEKRNKISVIRNEQIMKQFRETYQRSNQNSLMLYSQRPEYVFDLTYACHEATNQFREFTRRSMPLRKFIEKNDAEIARYDSLIGSLEKMMRYSQLDERARIDCNVCLTMATNIRNSMKGNRQDIADYERLFKSTEQRLKNLNDYANKRYNEIQSSIFKNGGESYFKILSSFEQNLLATAETVSDKYRPEKNIRSQWNSKIILDLFLGIFLFAIVSVILNLVVIRMLLPKRFQNDAFLKKRTCIIFATTTITFAVIIGLLRTFSEQNFLIMASNLLVEYAWLLGVILISLLLRVEGDQIKSAFRIYAPLIFMGFIVISFRIVLVPNDLVNLIFPPVLLLCTLWQWSVIRRHGKKIPRSDMFYTYISLVIFLVSTVSAWLGYTLLSVQLLIWWIMQLACILTITCFTVWMRNYSQRHKIDSQPITKTWFFRLVYEVLLPILSLLSIPLSIYMAADVFNLSDLTWQVFTKPFVDAKNLRISLFSIIQVLELYFFFKYLNKICLELLHIHFRRKNLNNIGSREVMGKNVTQVVVWGAWLLISLTILHVGGTWLGYIATGLSTGIGFASKDILENLYYGINLMAGRIKVGDWIECDGVKGKVASISYTSTMLEAIDGSVIAFTNSQLFTKNYKNLTKNHGYVLSLIPFGVAYGTKMKEVTAMIEEAVMTMHHPYLDPDKQVKVVFTEFGDSSINFKLLCWVDAIKQIYAVSDVMKCIYDTLNANNIEIPFPQRDVHLKDALMGRN
jgi:small-conductance mechanosensitive channel